MPMGSLKGDSGGRPAAAQPRSLRVRTPSHTHTTHTTRHPLPTPRPRPGGGGRDADRGQPGHAHRPAGPPLLRPAHVPVAAGRQRRAFCRGGGRHGVRRAPPQPQARKGGGRAGRGRLPAAVLPAMAFAVRPLNRARASRAAAAGRITRLPRLPPPLRPRAQHAACHATPLTPPPPHRLRQCMGRMFGFTLDVFSHAPTVAALGLQPLLRADYRRFATDNYTAFNWWGVGVCVWGGGLCLAADAWNFLPAPCAPPPPIPLPFPLPPILHPVPPTRKRYNVVGAAHRGFTYAVASGLYTAALWIGGGQARAPPLPPPVSSAPSRACAARRRAPSATCTNRRASHPSAPPPPPPSPAGPCWLLFYWRPGGCPSLHPRGAARHQDGGFSSCVCAHAFARAEANGCCWVRRRRQPHSTF